jgi:mono/diheme cytochrome c family protein
MSRSRAALFEDRAEAEPVQQRLRRAGVSAEIHDELGVARLWFVPKRRAGIRIEVPARQAELCRVLLLKWDAQEDVLRKAIRCPECRSLRVDFPQFTRKSVFTNLAIGLMAELGLVEREYYCEDCHCMWAGPATKAQRARAHLAPDYFLEDVQHESSHGPTGAGEGVLGSAGLRRVGDFGRARRSAPTLSARTHHRRDRKTGFNMALGALLLILGGRIDLVASAAHGESRDGEAAAAVAKDGATPPGSSPTYLRDVQPILMGKCARCHNDQTRFLQDWLDYRTAYAKRWEIKRRVWDSWRGGYFKQPMPTVNSPEFQVMSKEERATVRDWVESGAPRGVRPESADLRTKVQKIEAGKQLFATICAACHQPTGQGIPTRFPPLAGSDFLNADSHRAIRILVNGLQGEVVVNGQRFNNSMPKFPLSDQDVASALTYVYNSFGNSGQEVTADEVAAVRAAPPAPNESKQAATARVSEEKSPFE